MAPSSYFGSPEHRQDLATIASTPGAQLAPRIAAYEASSDDVMEWYGSDDPCNEDLNWQLVRSLASSNYTPGDKRELTLDTVAAQLQINEAAALTVLLGAAGITEGGEPGKPWTEAGHPAVRTALAGNTDLFAHDLIARTMSAPDIEQFDKLYVAVDCLQVASLGLHNIAVEGREGRIDLPDYEKYFRRGMQYRRDASELGSRMAQHIERQGPEVVIKSRAMLHRLSTIVCAIAMENDHAFTNRDETTEMSQTEKQTLSFLVNLVKLSFLDLHPGKVLKGADKGELHELLFLLDTNYLFSTGDSESRAWYGIASTDRHDAPKIGYPSKKRGLDFLFSNNIRARLVQLKSSTQDTSEYHPWILKIEEENFQEVDKRRLAAKVAAYKAWVDSDFDPALQARVDKYLLPSAKQTYDKIIEEGRMPESQRIIEVFGHGLTRAEKRRIMRNSGDFKKRGRKK
jgi:hypothetical protein